MTLLYNTGVLLYYLVLCAASVFSKKAASWVQGRKMLLKRLRSALEPGSPLVWFHCASLGEYEQARPVMETFRKAFPGYKILLTFFSPSGYAAKAKIFCADHVCYLPLDTKKNADSFIGIAKPRMAFFIRYEFWYNFMTALDESNIPFYLISGVFRRDQYFFKWYGKGFRKKLGTFTWLFTQDNESALILRKAGIKHTTVCGDTRVDRVIRIVSEGNRFEAVERFISAKSGDHNEYTVMVAGSTWKTDHDLLTGLINDDTIPLKYIIAPHEIKMYQIEKFMAGVRGNAVRFSDAGSCDPAVKVMVIDNIGMLSALYRYGNIAYVGGGFDKVVHNVLEAVVYGQPVVFGPHFHRSREAKELLDIGGAFSINDLGGLKKIIRFLLSDPYILKMVSEVTKSYIRKNRGATETILEKIREKLTA